MKVRCTPQDSNFFPVDDRRAYDHANTEFAPIVACAAYAHKRRPAAEFGAPDTIRTCGLHLRRVALYPAELRVHYAYAVLTRKI